MATVIFVSAFVWFLIMSPPESTPLQPRHPSRQQIDLTASQGTKKSLVDFIHQNNPGIDQEEANEIAYWIDEYSLEDGVDPMLVAALINRESSFNKSAVSETGAKGLGLIKGFNFDSLAIKDPFSIKQNVRGTVTYLKHLISMWHDSSDATRLALASYYQGPNATKKRKNNWPDHVTKYVDDVMKKYQALKHR